MTKQKTATPQLSDCSAWKVHGKRKHPRGTAGLVNIKYTPIVPIKVLMQRGLDGRGLDWHDATKYQDDTEEYMLGLSCKQKKILDGKLYAERKSMRREDMLSGANRIHEGEGQRIPLQKLQTGQSCIVWWAKWMKNAKEVPKSYNTKSRPAWYSGEIVTYVRYDSIQYCGIKQVPQHLYVIF